MSFVRVAADMRREYSAAACCARVGPAATTTFDALVSPSCSIGSAHWPSHSQSVQVIGVPSPIKSFVHFTHATGW